MATTTRSKTNSAARTRYEDDVFTWAGEQIELLRAGQLSEVDALNIAEELSDVANSIRSSLESAIAVLTMHLLKWDHQPTRRSRIWELTIAEQRRQIRRLLKRNPGLKSVLAEGIEEGYADGRGRALIETKLARNLLPEACPYLFDEMMHRTIEFEDRPARGRKPRKGQQSK